MEHSVDVAKTFIAKRAKFGREISQPVECLFSGGDYTARIAHTVERMRQESFLRRLWQRDAALWKVDWRHQTLIANTLGWLTVPEVMEAKIAGLETFALEVKSRGFTDAVLLGMGGSSLGVEVMRRTFGNRPGWPVMHVLDSTNPAAVERIDNAVDLEKTLFIVASKSGTTIEPAAFFSYFFDRVQQRKPQLAGENFVAITDPDTYLANQARELDFFRVFLNPPDIGGRYSVLSLFGLVPAAIMGLDLRRLLATAIAAMNDCRSLAAEDTYLNFAALLGGLRAVGRDKATIIAAEPLASLGLWIEQLVAESTGKENSGILPVAGEPPGRVTAYGQDRVFFCIALGSDAETAAELATVGAAGHPIMYQFLADEYSMGAVFFQWEVATALAGALLAINPFDQPNVQESKDNTKKMLDSYLRDGELPVPPRTFAVGDISVYAGGPANEAANASQKDIAGILRSHLALARPGDYAAILAYLPETPEHDRIISSMQGLIRDRLGLPATTGYGPRYLHSTGQYHKGGPDNGVFLLLTAADSVDLPIPGKAYSFGTLSAAQAAGDFEALCQHGRRVLWLDLPEAAGLSRIYQALQKSLGQ